MTQKRKHFAAIADTLEQYATRVRAGEFVDIRLLLERPECLLDPMSGECPLDGWNHFAPGNETTITLSLTHAT